MRRTQNIVRRTQNKFQVGILILFSELRIRMAESKVLHIETDKVFEVNISVDSVDS